VFAHVVHRVATRGTEHRRPALPEERFPKEDAMNKIASELLVERLIDWGVDTVFGHPGDGIIRADAERFAS
jgi:hypothetical protein